MRFAKLFTASVSLLLFVAATATAAEFKLDHFKVYDVKDTRVSITVALHGQFDKEPVKAQVVALTHFANNVSKNREAVHDRTAHLTWYRLEQDLDEPKREVEVENQFGTQRLVLGQPKYLLAPAEKREEGSAFPKELDHFKVYEVLDGKPVEKVVALADQFGVEREVEVGLPKFFCVPVEKHVDGKVTKIINREDHLTVYEIAWRPRVAIDQFGDHKLAFEPCEMLAVPSKKRFPPPPNGDPGKLDHFEVYDVKDVELPNEVALRGQFDGRVGKRAHLRLLTHFANPVSKNDEPIIDKNAHLTWYLFKQEEVEPKRVVTFENQFGRQRVLIGQPVYLLVPALKKEVGADYPKGLDHFKCYEVIEGKSAERPVVLLDQFGAFKTMARLPKFFCVPVEKTRGDVVEPIHNAKDHLVFYDIGSREVGKVISIGDQFNRPAMREISVLDSKYLGVPSVKLAFDEAR